MVYKGCLQPTMQKLSWAVLCLALQLHAKTAMQCFVIDLKQSMEDMEAKMYYQIPALIEASRTGNDLSVRYLAAIKKYIFWSDLRHTGLLF